MLNKEHYAKCFVIGGLFIGILSGMPGLSCCCCMWVILGGMLAGYLLCRWSYYPVSEGEGALVGLISGAIGAAVCDLLMMLNWVMRGPAQMQEVVDQIRRQQNFALPPEFEEMMTKVMQLVTQPLFVGVAMLILLLITFSILAPAGGFLAVTIWGKRPRPFPPGLGPTVMIPPPMAPPTGPEVPAAPARPAPGHDDQGFFFPR